LHLIKSYNSKGLYHLANQQADKLQKNISKKEKHDLEKSRMLRDLSHIQYYSNNPIKSTEGIKLLSNLSKYHTKQFNEQLLVYLIELHSVNSKYEDSLKEEIEYLESIIPNIKNTELSLLLRLCKEQLIGKDVAAFNKLKSKIHSIEPGTQLHTLITTYLRIGFKKMWALNLINNKNTYIELANMMMESSYNTIYIRSISFHNIVSDVCYYSDFESTTTFIDKWIGRVKAIANAIKSLYFEKYEKINSLLSNVVYENVQEKTRGLGIQAIGLYMTEDFDKLYDHNNNLRRLINRNKSKLREAFSQSILNLINVIDLLYKRKYDSTIVIDLAEHSPLIYKSWCLKQM